MLFIDEKVMVIRRHYFNTDDPNILIGDLTGFELIESSDHIQYLTETAELVTLGMNRGRATKELYDDLGNLITDNAKDPNVNLKIICQEVCKHYGVTMEEIQGHRRYQYVVEPMRVICYLSWVFKVHPEKVADMVQKHRTSVLHHIKTCRNQMQSDKKYRQSIEKLISLLGKKDIKSIINQWKKESSSASAGTKQRTKTVKPTSDSTFVTGSLSSLSIQEQAN